ncbi:pyridoxamine 5'-phosphate oxidase family protein [Skermania sp. ID1734]|uniref:pyridoxamine 5'-phosphate oxidase family protein n=1 Tax=Skermania sp. ID1734 TaxID=2597516 RepID=UPI00117F4830|nr:pyridoxamine 5'-phosphate oxidase family protein [Skermania sp. ID1734]TSD93625.1 pyridoxamine 5'-phosphate oxidase family protein [Skermania sp. ID1734]
MSVKVDLAQLADSLADFDYAYLATVGDDYRVHTVVVSPGFTDGALEVGEIGRHTRNNVTSHRDVTLIWPPRAPGGYTLIVDGTGMPADDSLRVIPTRAVLHRQATAESTSTSASCLHDCVPIEQAK